MVDQADLRAAYGFRAVVRYAAAKLAAGDADRDGGEPHGDVLLHAAQGDGVATLGIVVYADGGGRVFGCGGRRVDGRGGATARTHGAAARRAMGVDLRGDDPHGLFGRVFEPKSSAVARILDRRV